MGICGVKNLVGKVKVCNFALPNGTTPGGTDLRKLVAGKKSQISFLKIFLVKTNKALTFALPTKTVGRRGVAESSLKDWKTVAHKSRERRMVRNSSD